MNQSQALADFQKHCQRYFICYSFSSEGLKDKANQLIRLNPDRSKFMHVGIGHPDDGKWHGSMNLVT